MRAGGLDKLEVGQPCESHDLRIYGSVLHAIISHMEPQASAPKKAPAPIATFDRIEAALKAVPVSRLPEVYEILLEMLEDAEDVAAIEAAKDEPTVPFEQILDENGITREELDAVARSEGWLK